MPLRQRTSTTFPNPATERADDLIRRMAREPTPEQARTIRTLCLLTDDELPYDFGFGIDAIRLYWRDGRRVCIEPTGAIYGGT